MAAIFPHAEGGKLECWDNFMLLGSSLLGV